MSEIAAVILSSFPELSYNYVGIPVFLFYKLIFDPQQHFCYLLTKGEIHETLQICKSLTKRQIQCFNNVGCHGFEFATPYRALPSFMNDPQS
jgi:hypothetical protein